MVHRRASDTSGPKPYVAAGIRLHLEFPVVPPRFCDPGYGETCWRPSISASARYYQVQTSLPGREDQRGGSAPVCSLAWDKD